MALYMQTNDFSAERTTVTTNVPNNDVARLMYYMHCVCTAVNCDNDPSIQRFTSYNNWSRLSVDEQKVLFALCAAISPDTLNNRVFFHSDELCVDHINEFYTINQVRNQVLAAESIVIAGQERIVNKIMTYKMSWIENYYVGPMRRLAARFTTPPPRPAITYTTPRYRQPSTVVQQNRPRKKRSCCCKCCVISIVLLIVIIGIGIGVYFILKQRGII